MFGLYSCIQYKTGEHGGGNKSEVDKKPAKSVTIRFFCGEVAEWLKAAASKAVVRVSVPRVRIPPSPPFLNTPHQGRGHPPLHRRQDANPCFATP